MKKNKIFTLGLAIAFVFVLSLTLVSGTFAKYTSTVTGKDSAAVAKWAFKYGNNEGALTDIDLVSTKEKGVKRWTGIRKRYSAGCRYLSRKG